MPTSSGEAQGELRQVQQCTAVCSRIACLLIVHSLPLALLLLLRVLQRRQHLLGQRALCGGQLLRQGGPRLIRLQAQRVQQRGDSLPHARLPHCAKCAQEQA